MNLFLHFQNLQYLNLSKSGRTVLGAVLEWIRNRELSDVHIAGCNLRGTLTKFTKPDSLTFIDLSDNHFTPGISNFFRKLSSLQNVKISNNQLKFDITKITLPSWLSSLDLHSNLLFGSLSRIMNGQIRLNLKLLNVAGNRITGQLPSSISNLFRLETLKYLQKPDNRHNSYQFRITTEVVMLRPVHQWDNLLGIEQLRHANFRANKFCGEIPQGRPFNVFQAATYAHSLCLCSKPLPPCKRKKLEKKGQHEEGPA
ncbi:hypothetical protein RJ639_006809, partial [Escallonia herrerae]